MPRPNAKWQQKYGTGFDKHSPRGNSVSRPHLLNGDDTLLTAMQKLSMGNGEAAAIICQLDKTCDNNTAMFMMLDMDDMQMHGKRIVQAYHAWAKNDYMKMKEGIRNRDGSLIRFIGSVMKK